MTRFGLVWRLPCKKRLYVMRVTSAPKPLP